MSVIYQTFESQQIDTVIHTPTPGSRIIVCRALIEAPGVASIKAPGVASIKLGSQTIVDLDSDGESHSGGFIVGDIDETLVLNCPADTTITVCVEEA